MSWIPNQLDTFQPKASNFWNNVLNQFPNWAGPVNANGNTLSNLGNTTLGSSALLIAPQIGIGVSNAGQVDQAFTLVGGAHLARSTSANVGSDLFLGNGTAQWVIRSNNWIGNDWGVADPNGHLQFWLFSGMCTLPGGSAVLSFGPSVTDTWMPVSSITAWIDEPNNLLRFRCKYASGTVKACSIAIS